MKVTDIQTKILEVEEEYDEIMFSIKATVENDSNDTEIMVVIQGLDSDGFEIHSEMLDGNIPIGETRVLTSRSDMSKKLYEQIVKWQVK